MMKKTMVASTIAGLMLLAPFALGDGALPVNPILNGDFELYASPGGASAAEPVLNHCWGLGHQAFYGSDTLPGYLLGPWGAPEPTTEPEGAADYANAESALDYVGYQNCVASPTEGVDLVWLNPWEKMMDDAVHWSHDPANPGAAWGDFDGNGDREAKITAGEGSGHNMWQAYPSPFQAWTPDASLFAFDIENGATPVGKVLISLSAVPAAAQSDRVLLYLDCQLAFPATLLQASASANDGNVRIDPADGVFTSRHASCDELRDTFNADGATVDDKHAVLAQTRIVQVSFWGFQTGSTDLVIDNVEFVNAATAAEGFAGTLAS